MITKRVIAPLIIVIILSGIGGVFTAQTMTQKRTQQTTAAGDMQVPAEVNSGTQSQTPAETQNLPGRYTAYNAELASENYPVTVLFFYAAWCPECRAFKQAITASPVPEGVQVLEVNYDDETDLKKKYGVTLQTTFVKTNSAGENLGKWVGYGKEKNLNTVLENL